MADPWGLAWGSPSAWNGDWGTGEAPPPEVPSAEPIRYPGSHPYIGKRLEKRRIKQEVKEVIHRVAESQVERLETDKYKQIEELLRELELTSTKWEKRYLDALQEEREFLIEQEIGRLLRKKIQTEEEEQIIAVLMSIL